MRLSLISCLAACALVADVASAFSNDLVGRFLPRSKLSSPLSDATATAIHEGIVIFGGCVANQEYDKGSGFYYCPAVTNASTMYDPATDSYSPLKDMPRDRYRHAAAAIGSKIYLLGGRHADDAIVKEIDVYDADTDSWETLPCNFEQATSDAAAVTVRGTTILYVAGYSADYTAQSAVYTFDGTCEGIAKHSDLNEARGDIGVARNCDGDSVSVFGGFTHENDFAAPLATLETLESIAVGSSWASEKTPAGVGRGDKVFAQLHCRQYAFGGENPNHDGPMSTVEAHDNGVWHKVGEMSTKRFRFFGTRYGDEVYLFGGQGPIVGGPYGTEGSYFPLTDVVEQYRENARDASTVALEQDVAVLDTEVKGLTGEFDSAKKHRQPPQRCRQPPLGRGG